MTSQGTSYDYTFIMKMSAGLVCQKLWLMVYNHAMEYYATI